MAEYLEIDDNEILTSLTQLTNLTTVGGDLYIHDNDALASFCGLHPLISGNGLTGSYNVYSNTVNPTQQEIINGGSCSPIFVGNLHLFSQAMVIACYYTEVTGDLIINGNDIADLTPLSGFTTVGGTLYIYSNELLTSLAGLEHINSVGGNIEIGEDAIASLAGLESITSIPGYLYIYDNSELTSLAGLENITNMESLYISGNRGLTSLLGIDNITSLNGDLGISGNSSLTDLSGLEYITSLGGDLGITYNRSLTSLSGLDNISFLGVLTYF